jgi:tripartite-type tricarboxylate transporter receptor subunit TctC
MTPMKEFLRPQDEGREGLSKDAAARNSRNEDGMIRTIRRILIQKVLAAGLGAACGILALPALADEVADFYKGKTFTIVVGHEVGTGFDIYGRTLQRHLGRYIPGNPVVVVQNMTGASGLTAANWVANIAPRDGTVVATFVHTIPFEPLMGNASAKFDAAKLTWIGNMEESVAVCGVSKSSGIGKFDEMRTKEAVFGATGATGPLVKSALAVKNLLGVKMKVVSGYQGSASVKVAIQRGEVQGICGLPMSTVTSFWRDDYQAGNFKPIIQLSGRKTPELKDIPHVDDYAKTEEDRQVFGLIFGVQALGRIFVSPPAMPVARRNALRSALLATMKDPEFIADAIKTQIDISPMTGEEVEAFIARLSTASPAVVERTKQVFKND